MEENFVCVDTEGTTWGLSRLSPGEREGKPVSFDTWESASAVATTLSAETGEPWYPAKDFRGESVALGRARRPRSDAAE